MKQIPLNIGRKRSNTLVGLFAMVDDDDYDMLASRKWSCSFNKHFNGPGYAVTNTGRSTIAMHQVILQAPSGQMIDHIDRNPLNNQRANLRVVNHSQSLANRGRFKTASSQFKGVKFDGKLYRMQIVKHFDSEQEAADAYDACAKILFGEYAVLNSGRTP